MKVDIEKDERCGVDIELCVSVLNQLCSSIEFEALPVRRLSEHSSLSIDFEQEASRIQRKLGRHPADLYFFVTRRPFADSYFVHKSDNIVLISFCQWEYYTSLPQENGLIHFIARYLALAIKSLTHEDTTGCVYDFHWIKTGIDLCMREGHMCSSCYRAVRDAIGSSPKKQAIYRDIVSMLRAVANTSRTGRSVYTVLSDPRLQTLNWQTFEDLVADYYRALGAAVEQDCNVAGFQIDILATETTPAGRRVRTLVECKFHKARVGNRVVSEFARVFATIRDADLADAAELVSYAGFTQDAKLAAKHTGISLLHYKDVVQRLDATSKPKTPAPDIVKPPAHQKGFGQEQRRVFVIMPFSPEMDDTYFYGIQSAVRECGGVCVRMDQEEFNGGIIDEILRNIERASTIIAEVSRSNPNVYYEVGYAHALKQDVVLLTQDIKRTPFDLAGFNHVVYTSIRDLNQKLKRRLDARWSV